MIKKFISSSQFYLYSAYLPTLISLFTLPVITPYLTLRDYGIYGLLFSIYSFVSLIFNLGFTVEYQNSYFNERETYQAKWSKIIGFQVVWNLIALVPFTGILLAFVINDLTPSEAAITISSLLIPYLILDPVKVIGSRHLQYNDKHKTLFLITSIATCVQYGLVLVLIISLNLGFIAWFIGNLANSLITSSIYFIYLRKNRISIQLNFSFQQFKHRIKTQTSIILHNLSGYILETSDRILLSLFKVPIEQIGAYNIAYNYTNYGQTVNNSLNTVFSPMYFKSITKNESGPDEKQVSDLFKFWINLVVFMSVNMIIWADYLFAFLYRNQSLSSTYIYAFPMIVALVYRPFYVMVVDNLIIQQKTKYIVFISLSGAMLNVVLNIIFIPYFGILATVYSTAVAYIFLGFSGLFIKRIRKQLTHLYFKNYFLVMLIIVLSLVCVTYVDFSRVVVKVSLFFVSVMVLFILNRRQISAYLKRKELNS
jgi:O-antigen/teichoic acid export membrane protein